LFVSPFLFHLHALHHAYPSVPYHRLKALQSDLREGGNIYPVQERPGYLRSFLLYLDRLRGAQRMPAELPQ
jgi:fatty acid desaturase